MKIYKPRNKKWKGVSKGRFSNFFPERKSNLKSLENLTSFVWFYWFIVFAIKIGMIFPFIFFNPIRMHISNCSNGIIPPIATKHDLLDISSRHLFPIVIHKDGLIKVEYGYEIDLVNLSKLLLSKRINDPMLIVLFVVDKNCKMGVLNKVFNICRENNALLVRFVTSDHYKLIR